jgi:UDP-N-acetyl-2-amino-2-deoxyglucuronate dehydrogenase
MPVRLGVVGCGAIYATHATAIQRIPNAALSGFYDVVPERSEAASAEYMCPAFDSLEKLCEVSDAVSICVPSGLHAELGIQAALLGRHVLVEKPIDVTIDAATNLVETCRSAGVKLSVISQHRFAPDIQRLKEAVTRGDLGPMLQGDAYIKWYRTQNYYDSGSWRGTWKLDGGGCLMNQGVHYVDMIQWVMGGVASVQAQVRTVAHQIEVEDVAAALIEYKNGAIGVIQGSTSFFPGFTERLEVHGRYGSIVIDGDLASAWEVDEERERDLSKYGRGVTMQPTPNLRPNRLAENPTQAMRAETWIEQHRLQIQDFVESVEQDREPYVTGENALEPLKIILAIYESSKLDGARVKV